MKAMFPLPRSSRLTQLCVVCFLVLMTQSSGLADTVERCLELQVEDADVVVVAHLRSLAYEGDDGYSGYVHLTFDVLEMLKGPAQKTVEVWTPLKCGYSNTAFYNNDNLLFLNRASSARVYGRPGFQDLDGNKLTLDDEKFWDAITLPDSLRFGPPAGRYAVPGIGMDLSVYRTRAEILNAVRRAAMHVPAAHRRQVEREIPYDTPTGQNRMSAAYVVLPVDDRLERLAQDGLIDPRKPAWGLHELGLFRSQSNAQLIQKYLDDPTSNQGYTYGRDAQTVFWKRAEASAILRSWDYDTPMREDVLPDERYRPASFFLAALLMLLILFVIVSLRRSWKVAPVLATIFFSLFIILWIRSMWRDDDLMLERSNVTYWCSSHDGAIQLGIVHKAVRYAQSWQYNADQPDDGPNNWANLFHARKTPRGLQFASFHKAEIDNLFNVPGPNLTFDRFGIRIIRGYTDPSTLAVLLPYNRADVPWKFAAIIPTVFMAIAYLRWYRVATRIREGCCKQCGYDLRSSPDRCPECGTIR
jgi:hypothetical protein